MCVGVGVRVRIRILRDPFRTGDCSYIDQCSLRPKTDEATDRNPEAATTFGNAAGLGVLVSSKSHGTQRAGGQQGSEPLTHLAPE